MQLAQMSIDPKLVEPTADVVEKNYKNNTHKGHKHAELGITAAYRRVPCVPGRSECVHVCGACMACASVSVVLCGVGLTPSCESCSLATDCWLSTL